MFSRPTSDSRRPAAREDFFRPVPTEGALRLADGQRASALPAEFLHSLHETLARDLGENAPQVLYACGYEWSLQDMVRLTRRLGAEFAGGNLDLWQLDARFVLDTWWAPLTAAGWGAWMLDLSTHLKGITFVELRHSAVAAIRPGASEPVCHLYAGLFAGALSFFERSENHAVEIQCAATGHAACKFVIGPGAQIDAVESWRKQGASADEIRRRLS